MDIPSPNFRKTWNNSEVHELLFEGIITRTDSVVIAVIESFAGIRKMKRKASDPPFGCFASPVTIARQSGLSTRHCCQILRNLIEAGFIRVIGYVNYMGYKRRLLVTKWTRVNYKKLHKNHGATGSTQEYYYYIVTPGESKTTLPNGGKKSEGGDEMKGFGIGQSPPKKDKTSIEAKELSKILREFCASQLWFVSKSPKKWSPQIQQIINQIGFKETKRILFWYVENHPTKFRMKLQSGKDFKDHFEKVRLQADKDKSAVKASSKAKLIAQKIDYFGWPKGSKKQLPVAVQITLDNYEEFYRKVVLYAKQPKIKWAGIAQMFKETIPVPVTFTEGWFLKVFKRIAKWKEWHGDLTKEAWDGNVEQLVFWNWGREIINNYCGRPDDWKSYIQELGYKL